jgi:hypothetical protein
MIKQILAYLFNKKEPQGQVFNFNLPDEKPIGNILAPKSLYVIQSRLKKRRRRASLSQQSRLQNSYML